MYKALTEDVGPIVPNQTWTDQCKPCLGDIADRQFGSSAEEVGAAQSTSHWDPVEVNESIRHCSAPRYNVCACCEAFKTRSRVGMAWLSSQRLYVSS